MEAVMADEIGPLSDKKPRDASKMGSKRPHVSLRRRGARSHRTCYPALLGWRDVVGGASEQVH